MRSAFLFGEASLSSSTWGGGMVPYLFDACAEFATFWCVVIAVAHLRERCLLPILISLYNTKAILCSTSTEKFEVDPEQYFMSCGSMADLTDVNKCLLWHACVFSFLRLLNLDVYKGGMLKVSWLYPSTDGLIIASATLILWKYSNIRHGMQHLLAISWLNGIAQQLTHSLPHNHKALVYFRWVTEILFSI